MSRRRKSDPAQQDLDFTAPPPPPPRAPSKGNGSEDGSNPRTRQQQMFARFIKFHLANKHIWRLVDARSLELIRQGRDHYSIDEVIQYIRHHTPVKTVDDAPYAKIKISDHYRAYYARLFLVAHPEHDGFFSIKKLRSEDWPPYKNEPSPEGAPAGPELDLTEQLKKLLE